MDTTDEVIQKFKRERIQKLEAMPIIDVCKAAIADPDVLLIGEHELCGLITKAAQKEHPGLRADIAFAKVFSEPTERGRLLRAACNMVKAAGPMFDAAIIDPDEKRTAVNNTEQSEAYEQLSSLAEKLHAAATGKLSKEQAFARVLADPSNRLGRARARSAGGPGERILRLPALRRGHEFAPRCPDAARCQGAHDIGRALVVGG
jgi:hypothetical protein